MFNSEINRKDRRKEQKKAWYEANKEKVKSYYQNRTKQAKGESHA